MPAEGHRRLTAQNRGRRIHEVRRLALEEQIRGVDDTGFEREGAILVNDIYASINTVDESTALWGPGILVEGIDRMTLFLNHTAGTNTSAVHLAIEVSYTNNAETADWYDYYEDEGVNGTLVRKDFAWTTSASGRIAWNFRAHGRYMRFKVWTDGVNRANSRIVLYARRLQDAS